MKKRDLRRERELQRRQEYKTFILKAAEAVISKKGLSSATMDDIAREAQFSKATIYHYFKGKGELIYELIGNFFEQLNQKLKEIRAMKKPAQEKIKEGIRYFLEFHEEKENISRALMMDNFFIKKLHMFVTAQDRLRSDTDRRFVASIKAKRKEILDGVCEILREGMAAGEFRKMNVWRAVLFLDAVLNGYCHGKFWLEKKYSLKEETDLIHSFFLHGIGKKSENRKGES